jgi:molybdenum cofactor cytidylyltransferase
MNTGTGVVILAAGGSSRMGRPKQLLSLDADGTTLLRRSADTALALGLGPVLVVLGAVAESCQAHLAGRDLACILNPHWEKGLGGSIALGVAAMAERDVQAVLLLLCDQPNLRVERLLALHALHASSGTKITAARYEGSWGPPAIFDRALFPDLMRLDGTEGAKKIILALPGMQSFDMPEAAFDLDGPGDYDRWMSENRSMGAPR